MNFCSWTLKSYFGILIKDTTYKNIEYLDGICNILLKVLHTIQTVTVVSKETNENLSNCEISILGNKPEEVKLMRQNMKPEIRWLRYFMFRGHITYSGLLQEDKLKRQSHWAK